MKRLTTVIIAVALLLGGAPRAAQAAWDIAKAAATAISALSPQYVDRREDRLVLYADISPDIREYVYRAKAIAKGKFVVPPPYAESLYQRDIFAQGGAAGSLEVKAPAP